jgi:hypothetical protein
MIPTIHLTLFFKLDEAGKVLFKRAYKYMDKPKDLTPRFSHFLYSHKSERYHETLFYVMDWAGNQIELPEGVNLHNCRNELLRIGLDLR